MLGTFFAQLHWGTFVYPGGIRDHTSTMTPQVQNSKCVLQHNKSRQKEQIALNSSLKMETSEPKKATQQNLFI